MGHPGTTGGRAITLARFLSGPRGGKYALARSPPVPPSPIVVDWLDLAWLDEAARRDPIAHVWSVWDLKTAPDKVQFVSLREAGATRAYLLIWRGTPGRTVVHWVGETSDVDPLLGALPARPIVAVVPPEMAGPVADRRGPADRFSVLIMRHARPTPVPLPGPEARRLTNADRAAVVALEREHSDLLTQSYARANFDREWAFGAFEGNRLVAVAHASVSLPSMWVVGGIFTLPDARGRGHGTRVTTLATRAAIDRGATPILYVREDNWTARQIYERLGYRTATFRVWLDAGAGVRP